MVRRITRIGKLKSESRSKVSTVQRIPFGLPVFAMPGESAKAPLMRTVARPSGALVPGAARWFDPIKPWSPWSVDGGGERLVRTCAEFKKKPATSPRIVSVAASGQDPRSVDVVANASL
jgi:hypothetical protein